MLTDSFYHFVGCNGHGGSNTEAAFQPKVEPSTMGTLTKLGPKRNGIAAPQSSAFTDLDLDLAAKAAGGRVASPSEASRLKAEQSKTVHIICSGLTMTPPTSVAVGGGQQAKGSAIVPVSQASKGKGKATSVVKTERISDAQPLPMVVQQCSIQQSNAKSVTRIQEDAVL